MSLNTDVIVESVGFDSSSTSEFTFRTVTGSHLLSDVNYAADGSQVTTTFDPLNTQAWTSQESTYAAGGAWTRVTTNYDNGTRMAQDYDAAGRVDETRMYDTAGRVDSITNYDDANRVDRITAFDDSNRVDSITNYDDSSRVDNITLYDDANLVDRITVSACVADCKQRPALRLPRSCHTASYPQARSGDQHYC
jgi:YD repeat-containing protein